MELCSRCQNPAKYVLADRGAKRQWFCRSCLPWFLEDRARNGGLGLVNQEDPIEQLAEQVKAAAEADPKPRKPRKKKVAEPAPEPSEEEPAVEEPVVEVAEEPVVEAVAEETFEVEASE